MLTLLFEFIIDNFEINNYSIINPSSVIKLMNHDDHCINTHNAQSNL